MTVTLSAGEIKLTEEELLIDVSQKDGYAVASDRGVTVVLNIQLDDKLIEEGFVREIISKIQTMRKDAGFEVMDNIRIYCSDNEKIKGIIERNKEEISENTLTAAVEFGKAAGYTADWDINGEKVSFGVEKV